MDELYKNRKTISDESRELVKKANVDHQKYLVDNKVEINKKLNQFENAKKESHDRILEEHLPLEYRTTIDQVIKNCRLRTYSKFLKEINFTEDQHT